MSPALVARGAEPRPAPSPAHPLRAVAVPSEHGGWALTLEPAVLGLLLAPSWAGAALGGAALLAFAARTPLKLALVDRYRHRRLQRTVLATRVVSVELVVLAGLVAAVALTTASPWWWVPLLAAAPLVAVQLSFDARSRSRRLVPELAGATGMASVAAATVLAGGGPVTVAAGTWALMVARSVASLPFVRRQLRRFRHAGETLRIGSDLGQAAAVLAAGGAAAAGWVPVAAVAVIVALVGVQQVLDRRPPYRAVIVGVQQTVLGVAVVVASALVITIASNGSGSP